MKSTGSGEQVAWGNTYRRQDFAVWGSSRSTHVENYGIMRNEHKYKKCNEKLNEPRGYENNTRIYATASERRKNAKCERTTRTHGDSSRALS